MTKRRPAAIGMLLFGVASVSSAGAQTSLTASRGHGADRTYYTIDGAQSGEDSFNTGGPVLANAVLPPKVESILVEIVLNVRVEVPDLGSFDVFVAEIDPNGHFYSMKVIGNVSDRVLTRDFKRIRMEFGGSVPRAGNKRFYVGIRKHSGAHCSVVLGRTTETAVFSRPEVADSASVYNNRGEQPNSSGVYQMIVALRE